MLPVYVLKYCILAPLWVTGRTMPLMGSSPKALLLEQNEDMIHTARPQLDKEADELYEEAKRRMAQRMTYTGV